MKYLTTLILLASLAGCATSGKINGLQIGMTKEQVIAAMGNPVSVSAKDGTEYLNYKLSETDDDAFRGWTSPYYVRLIKGKVDSYGRTGDFDSTKNPTIRIEKDESIKVEGNKDMFTELKKLKELKDDGIITETEFQEKKKVILNGH
ncbi:MAG: SHOCT domain-containing protein [Candidatus Nitrotoga sp.]